MLLKNEMNMSGELTARVIRAKDRIRKAPLSWKLRNSLRMSYILGFIYSWLARAFSKLTGIPTMLGELSIRLIRASGEIIRRQTLADPADSPKIVTHSGLPPKAAMFR